MMFLLAVVVAYPGTRRIARRFTPLGLRWSAFVSVLLVILAVPLLPRLQRLVDGATVR